jgi:hypothetical protein
MPVSPILVANSVLCGEAENTVGENAEVGIAHFEYDIRAPDLHVAIAGGNLWGSEIRFGVVTRDSQAAT